MRHRPASAYLNTSITDLAAELALVSRALDNVTSEPIQFSPADRRQRQQEEAELTTLQDGLVARISLGEPGDEIEAMVLLVLAYSPLEVVREEATGEIAAQVQLALRMVQAVAGFLSRRTGRSAEDVGLQRYWPSGETFRERLRARLAAA